MHATMLQRSGSCRAASTSSSAGTARAAPLLRRSGSSRAASSRTTTTSSARRARLAAVRVCASSVNREQMLQTVHRWFDSLHSADHPVEDLVTPDVHYIDSTNEACYGGYRAIKHRMQSVHEVLPSLREAADVVDAGKRTVAAHWTAQAASGTMVFHFNEAGLIEQIESHADGAEDEFLEA